MADQGRPTSQVAVFDTVRRRWPGTDAYMSPGEGCLDCFIGEPHVCPLLAWTTFSVVEDEHGVCTVTDLSDQEPR